MPQLPLEPIRQAVNSGEFDRAQFLWNQCAAGLAEELRTGSLSAARLSEVRELVEWSRLVVLCERAHMQDQLNSLHVAGEYELDVPPSAHCLVEASF
ncbi:MAG: hypothetical protein NTW28_08075 [Candidatus Solibacter sp.]|nr:hypothetical protein [Candidatus Solibacter sp.]